MKRMTISLLAIVLLFVASSCSDQSGSKEAHGKYIASFYPIEYILIELTGTPNLVENITPLGAEPHEIELSPDAIIKLQDSKYVFAIGGGFQPSLESSVSSLENKVFIIDNLFPNSKISDQHFWLDPILMKDSVDLIAKKLIELDPNKAIKIEQNKVELINKLDKLDLTFKEKLSNCKFDTIITTHEAFGYIAKRYGFKQESIAGYSPENEPSPKRLNQLVTLISKLEIKTIFTENLSSDKLAKALASETGIKTENLNALEYLTKDEQENGKNYISIMQETANKLSDALECN